MKAHPRTRYVTAAPETWSLIRGAYLSGLSAPTLSARFGVSVTAIRKRAAREGWTKRSFAARASPWSLCPSAPTASAPTAQDPAAPAPTAPQGPPALDEDAVMVGWQGPLTFRSADVARKALSGAVAAIRAGNGLNAVRLARAAGEVARLDALIDYADEDIDDRTAGVAARDAMMRTFIRQQAVVLARDLAAGRPLPDRYREALALCEADEVALAALDGGSDVS